MSGTRSNDTPDRIVMAILARSMKTYLAVLHLCEGGFGEQAAMLNRALFEDLADAAWATTHPEVARRNFAEQAELEQLHTYEVVARKYPRHAATTPPLSKEQHEKLKWLRKRYGEHADHSWTRRSVYRRLKESQDLWDEGDRESIWIWYDVIHRRHNAYLHTSPITLDATFVGVQDGDVATFKAGPTDTGIKEALYAAAWIITITTTVALRHFEATTTDEFTAFSRQAIRTIQPLTEDQLMGVGRNDPCPCGSGHKYKRCHQQRA